MTTNALKTKTMAELRALAKAHGLRGYSKLRKDELVRLLAKTAIKARAPTATTPRKVPAPATRSRKKRATKRARATPSRTRPAAASPPAPPARAMRPAPSPPGIEEQRVMQAKFTLSPRRAPGTGVPTAPQETEETIEPAPRVTEPLVRLLPQRPGVAYAYWVLPEDALARDPGLRLRLYYVIEGTRELLEELALESARGERHFRIPLEVAANRLVLALESARRPEPTIERQAAPVPRAAVHAAPSTRLPSAFASPRTDARWPVGEERFRALYLRAGGTVQAEGLAWAASVSSPRAWPQPQGAPLGWSASVSSR